MTTEEPVLSTALDIKDSFEYKLTSLNFELLNGLDTTFDEKNLMKIALVGATGMVGEVMLRVLEERNLPLSELLVVASEKSIGKLINFKNQQLEIIGIETALAKKPSIAIFSAGGSISVEWAPKFAAQGCTVIDNSSAWRMHEEIKLIVPEINASSLNRTDKIIANPNCSTIQLSLIHI